MKTLIWALVALVIGIGIIVEMRYDLVVNSPVVAKIDRLTGDTWIVNSGRWVKVQVPLPGSDQAASVPTK